MSEKSVELEQLAEQFEQAAPQEIVAYALDRFHPDITLACSFGAEDVVLVDMVVRVQPGAKIFYLDTEFHFQETYEVRDRLIERYGIEPIAVRSLLSADEQASLHGAELYWRAPDRCCQLRKVEPLQRILKNFQAWITGIRREQSPARAHARTVEWDKIFNLVKFNPLARWQAAQVWDYIRRHNVPYNVLHDRNYPSIGCWPCTRPVEPGQDPRAGRWAGFAKTECGLHQATGGGAQ